jgi:ferredoxin
VKVLSCTCRGTMPYAADVLAAACGATGAAHELCRAEIGRFRAALDGPVMVTCTQEAPAFRIAAAEAGSTAPLHFVNIRETAGWSDEASRALPKVAALVAQAQALAVLPLPDTVTLESAGVTLIYGNDERALEAAEQLRDRLDLTVMLTGPATPSPLRISEFPVLRGTVRRATGHLGAFELVVDGFARAVPSSRASLAFETARDNAVSRCDLIIDLTGGVPLFPAAREGYLRPDPNDPVGVQKALFAATDLIGTFDKPRPVVLDPAACAHERSGQNGCNRCLDNCPVGAINPAGDAVVIDPAVCAGCGTCAAMCPTDAIRWTVPNAEAMARRLRALLGTYRQAGGIGGRVLEPPVLLLHDAGHGEPLVDMLARAGDGLPARVIPVLAPQVMGLDVLASAFAFGAAELRVLLPARHVALRDSWEREVVLVDTLLQQLGYGTGRIGFIETDDPFTLGEQLRSLPTRAGPAAATLMPTGRKRDITLQALDALAALAPHPLPVAALPVGAPFGRIHVADGCTLCLSCVSACPTSALRDDPERPKLRFIENNCVQCGLCASTCPENVITLEPRIAFGQARREIEILREAEPALCISCSKPFGVKASIDRVAEKLVGQHWMFSDPAVIARIRMCADCRMRAQVRQGLDPYAAGPRPMTRTTDDYR